MISVQVTDSLPTILNSIDHDKSQACVIQLVLDTSSCLKQGMQEQLSEHNFQHMGSSSTAAGCNPCQRSRR